MVEFEIRENCGLDISHSLHDAYSMGESLQHRGREVAGVGFIGEKIDAIKWIGPLNRFDLEDLYKIFPSPDYHTYFFHVRYATKGQKDREQILLDGHPHVIGGKVEYRKDHVIIRDCDVIGVHNGQVNPEYLNIDKNQLKTGCDTEALLHFFRENNERELLKRIPGSYTLAIASKKNKEVIVMRDRMGIKPGVLGLKDGKYIVASEDIVIRENGGKAIENLEPGCIYYLSADGSYRKEKVINSEVRHCFFEYNYISSVDSMLDGLSVKILRETLGEVLAKEFCPKADIVTFLPRCPEVAARRYAEKTNIPFEYIFYKPRAERAFLGSTLDDRQKSIEENLYLIPEIRGISSKEFLQNKTLTIIDDSTIRGNNSKRAIYLVKNEAKVKKVYLINYTSKIGVIGNDGVKRGCLYGVDMPPDDKFIVRGRTDQQINEEFGAGVEVYFMSIEGMLGAFEESGMPRTKLCTFCIGGNKPF